MVTAVLLLQNGFRGRLCHIVGLRIRAMRLICQHIALTLGATLLFGLSHSSLGKTTVVHVGQNGDTFSPAMVTIRPGDKIEWVWDSSFHSTTSGSPGHPSGMWNSD